MWMFRTVKSSIDTFQEVGESVPRAAESECVGVYSLSLSGPDSGRISSVGHMVISSDSPSLLGCWGKPATAASCNPGQMCVLVWERRSSLTGFDSAAILHTSPCGLPCIRFSFLPLLCLSLSPLSCLRLPWRRSSFAVLLPCRTSQLLFPSCVFTLTQGCMWGRVLHAHS